MRYRPLTRLDALVEGPIIGAKTGISILVRFGKDREGQRAVRRFYTSICQRKVSYLFLRVKLCYLEGHMARVTVDRTVVR